MDFKKKKYKCAKVIHCLPTSVWSTKKSKFTLPITIKCINRHYHWPSSTKSFALFNYQFTSSSYTVKIHETPLCTFALELEGGGGAKPLPPNIFAKLDI